MNGALLFLFALVLSIALGLIFKLNVGMLAFIAAMIIGSIVAGLSPNAIAVLWPTRLFLMLLFVMLFFGFAVVNKTLDSIALHIVWVFRKIPALIPFVLLAICSGLTAMGLSSYALFAIMAPLTMMIAAKLNIHRIIAACAVLAGGSVGGYVEFSQLGAITLNTLRNLGYELAEARHILHIVHINQIICWVTLMVILYFVFGGYRAKVEETQKPDPFTKEQARTVVIFGGVMFFIIFFALTREIFSKNITFVRVANGFDVITMALIGIVLCIIMKVGKAQEAIQKIPMDTIILVCGISTLISIGTEVGAVKIISDWAVANIKGSAAPYFMSLVSGVFSVFASGNSVVVPTMGTMIPGLVAATGHSAALLFSLSACTANLTGMSPFSTAGGFTLSGVTEPKVRDTMFKWLLVIPIFALVMMQILILLGVLIK